MTTIPDILVDWFALRKGYWKRKEGGYERREGVFDCLSRKIKLERKSAFILYLRTMFILHFSNERTDNGSYMYIL